MSIKFTILGCGSSVGVPRADGFFGKCDPKEKKNYRTRCSSLISTNNKNILIDTSPDLRNQLLSNKITNVDAVLYTHMHADQTHGINELRLFYLKYKKKIPVYANNLTRKYLKKSFSFCFKKTLGYPSILSLKKLKGNHKFKDHKNCIFIKSIPVEHGHIKCMSFIINKKCAYASDVSLIPKKNLKYFKNLNYLIIDCLRFKKHPSHYNLDEVLDLIKKIKPKKTILTNLNNEMDYKSLIKILPRNVTPAFDGMSFLI